jgi:hypothetical protein
MKTALPLPTLRPVRLPAPRVSAPASRPGSAARTAPTFLQALLRSLSGWSA